MRLSCSSTTSPNVVSQRGCQTLSSVHWKPLMGISRCTITLLGPLTAHCRPPDSIGGYLNSIECLLYLSVRQPVGSTTHRYGGRWLVYRIHVQCAVIWQQHNMVLIWGWQAWPPPVALTRGRRDDRGIPRGNAPPGVSRSPDALIRGMRGIGAFPGGECSPRGLSFPRMP